MKAHHHYSIHALFAVALAVAIALLFWRPGYAQPQTQARTPDAPVGVTVTGPAETVLVTAPRGLKPFDMEECYLDGRRECVRVTCVEWATRTGWQRACANHGRHFP